MFEFDFNNQVEDYLDRTCSPMIGQKPYEERAAIREELKNHLLAAIEASKELGASDAEAVDAAMKMIGKPEQVSRSFGVRKGAPWNSIALAVSVLMFSASLWISHGQIQQPPKFDEKRLIAQMPSGAISHMHTTWVAEHQCTECHRSTVQNRSVQSGAQAPFQTQ